MEPLHQENDLLINMIHSTLTSQSLRHTMTAPHAQIASLAFATIEVKYLKVC